MHFLHKSADVETAVHQTIRGAFEYNGQKCSATSRVYVPDTLWPQFSEMLKKEVATIKQGSVEGTKKTHSKRGSVDIRK